MKEEGTVDQSTTSEIQSPFLFDATGNLGIHLELLDKEEEEEESVAVGGFAAAGGKSNNRSPWPPLHSLTHTHTRTRRRDLKYS